MIGPRFSRSAPLLGAWLSLLAGCPDPAGKFDEFAARVQQAPVDMEDDAGMDGCPLPDGELPGPEQISGLFLFTVATSLDPHKPFVYLLEVEASKNGDNYKVSMRERALSAKDHKTPVEDFGDPREFEVSPAGCFVTDRTTFNIPAEANPIIALPAVTELVLGGNVAQAIQEPDGDRLVTFWCGTVDGDVISPLPQSVNGSAFTAVRVTDPDNLPEVVIDCDMTPVGKP